MLFYYKFKIWRFTRPKRVSVVLWMVWGSINKLLRVDKVFCNVKIARADHMFKVFWNQTLEVVKESS